MTHGVADQVEVRSSGMSLAHAPDQMRAEKDLVIEVQDWWTKEAGKGSQSSSYLLVIPNEGHRFEELSLNLLENIGLFSTSMVEC